MDFDPKAGLGTKILPEMYPKLVKQDAVMAIPSDLEVRTTKNGPRQKISREDWDMLLRYTLMFVWPHNNPVWDMNDFTERQDTCITELDVQSRPIAVYLIKTDHVCVRDLIVFWLQLACTDVYELWFTQRILFSNLNKYLRSPAGEIDDTTKAASYTKLLPEVVARLQALEVQLFPDNKVKMMANEKEVETFYAEKYAQDW